MIQWLKPSGCVDIFYFIIREEPNSFRILREVVEVPFLWDVTNIVLEWTTGLFPNRGIALKQIILMGLLQPRTYMV